MAHFAKLDENNIVVTVLAGRDEDNEQELTERTGEVYKQTSYNGNFRSKYAGIGDFYDEVNDIFISPVTESIVSSFTKEVVNDNN
jgi:hypothetical protein